MSAVPQPEAEQAQPAPMSFQRWQATFVAGTDVTGERIWQGHVWAHTAEEAQTTAYAKARAEGWWGGPYATYQVEPAEEQAAPTPYRFCTICRRRDHDSNQHSWRVGR